jgi:signal peptidase I
MAASVPHPVPSSPDANTVSRQYGVLRQCADSVVYLALAVILFRGFAAEGYMISTGSMAPCLLGYHHQIVCPSCSFAFSRGTQFDGDETVLAAPGDLSPLGGDDPPPAVSCPNCGLEAIDAVGVPRNEGDQLLVHKHLYQLRLPRRWEVVVFRHPKDPLQAYVKRVVGLPGERVEVRDGDVYADGRLQRKTLETQRSMRICVYDHDCAPNDPQWHPRWQAVDGDGWSAFHSGFVHRRSEHDSVAGPGADTAQMHWLSYHHWIRGGGQHRTSAGLAAWPDELPLAHVLDRKLRYDPAEARLEYEGVMPSLVAESLRGLSADVDWQHAIDELQCRSHEVPIGDVYGYNLPEAGEEPTRIHDLMLEAVVARTRGEGQWRVQMSDGWHNFTVVFDIGRRRVLLYTDEQDQPLRTAPLPDGAFADTTLVEVSLFDRQVLVALDGELPFAALPYPAPDEPRRLASTPVRIGAGDLDLHLSHLRLYRDVHYTARQAPGRDEVTQLGPDEFYMLGDNSPVSLDSRGWDAPAIPRKLLIGKPFVVHLPSRQGRLDLAGGVYHFRIPDFSRIRYIR